MPALPLRRAGRGFCPARRAGAARTGQWRRRAPSAPDLTSSPFPPVRAQRQPRPGAASLRLTKRPPRRSLNERAPAFPQTSRLLAHVFLPIRPIAGALCGAVAALWLTPAYPHAVCGDRIFPATLAIDDPGVLDELTLPTVSWVPYNSDGAHEWDASFSWTKTITPGLSVVIGDGPTWEHPGGYGWNALDTELQWQALCIPDAEFMFKVGFDVILGRNRHGNL